jgi:hypothetical protein
MVLVLKQARNTVSFLLKMNVMRVGQNDIYVHTLYAMSHLIPAENPPDIQYLTKNPMCTHTVSDQL